MNDDQRRGEREVEIPMLESPPESDVSPESQANLLLDAETLSTLSTRLLSAEALMGLLVRNLTFSEFMREVLLVFLRAIKCEAGSILEANQSQKALFFRAIAGQASDRLSNVVIPWGAGVVGYVAESRQPVLVADARSDSRHLNSVSDSVGFESRNLVAAPVVIRDRVFCVVELFNRIGKARFDEQDRELLVQIAAMAAKVIEVRMMLNGVRKADAA